jgi:hypothetical protein
MNAVKITSTAILSLLGIVAPAYAQHEQQDQKQDHPEQKQSEHEQAKPQQEHGQQQQHAQQQPQQQDQKQQHAQQQPQPDRDRQQHAQQQPQQQDQRQQHAQQQQRGNEYPKRTQEEQRVQQSAWQEHRSQRWDSDHRNWQQRGGYNGYRIPNDRYRGYFGQDHGFRIYGLPFLVVGGYPRFQYEGYWISLVDPWPEYWGNDWYDNDDVFVTYADNGYYLYNRRYPNVGIAIRISM